MLGRLGMVQVHDLSNNICQIAMKVSAVKDTLCRLCRVHVFKQANKPTINTYINKTIKNNKQTTHIT